MQEFLFFPQFFKQCQTVVKQLSLLCFSHFQSKSRNMNHATGSESYLK